MNKTGRIRIKYRIRQIAVLLLIFCYISVLPACSKNNMKEEINAYLASGETSLFVSMFDISGFQNGMFSRFMGRDVYFCRSYEPQDISQLCNFLKKVSNSKDKKTEYLLIGLDPEKMTGKDKELESLKEAFSLYSDIQIEVFLPTYPKSYWDGKNESEREFIFANYKKLSEGTLGLNNVYLYFEGDKMWMLGNPNVYSDLDKMALKENAVNEFVLLETIFSHNDWVMGEGVDLKLELLTRNLEYLEEKAIVPNSEEEKRIMKEKTSVVFLTDSICGLFDDPTSIPSVTEYFLGSPCYNCGIGGLPIVSSADKAGLSELMSAVTDPSAEGEKWEDYFLTNHVIEGNTDSFREGRKLCTQENDNFTFVIELGLNDYFEGYDLKTTEECLLAGIQKLQQKYPDSRIILLVPGNIDSEVYGAGEKAVSKDAGNLEDYRNIVRTAGKNTGCEIIELSDISFFSDFEYSDYLDYSGIHYNELGRFFIGVELARYLEEK